MSQIPDEIYLTVSEVSQLLKLSELTIYKYIKDFNLPAVQFGGHYRIPKSALELFIEEHKVIRQEEYE